MKKLPNPGRGFLSRVLLFLSLTAPVLFGQQTITQTEQDDSIPTANATGFTAGSSGIKVAFGHTGDGLYGDVSGDQSGDVDFFKISANAGQIIYVNINNAGIDPDFDPLVAVYRADGEKVAENDDEGDTSRGYDRTSRLTYTADAAGDYYVCVTNWIADTPSVPNDPLTPGTSPGPPGGNSGPYQLFLGLDVAVPIPQFVGGSTGYPVPTFLPIKVLGTPRLDGRVTIRNTSTGAAPGAAYTITSYAITGPNASRFTITGLNTPLTLAPGAEITATVSFDGVGFAGLAQATLELTTNDPFAQNFKLDTFASPVVGGGQFAVKQIVSGGVDVNSMEVADSLLDGTNPGTTYNAESPAINYGTGAQAHFDGDRGFPDGAGDPDDFTMQVTGTFFIREAGTYTFLGNSDDGQRLKIDGNEVFFNTAANTDTFGFIELTAGAHQLEFTMWENAGGHAAELLISRQIGEFDNFLLSTWELLEAYSQDADEDGMPDAYEIANGTNKDVNDAAVDADTDGLTNIQEYSLGTKPTVADTDADGLKDGVETKTGIYASAASTGTNPLVADTDGDGFLDGIENPALPYTGAAQPGTDPNKKDTDGDGYADLSEPSLGTNPTVAASVPVFDFKTALSDNFDEPGFHSVFKFKNLNGSAAFTPGIYDTVDEPSTKVAQLNEIGVNGTHNAIAFDYVDTPGSTAVKLEFDFRLSAPEGDTNPADGFGIGFFRKSVYGTTDVSPLILNDKAWENPTGAGGYPDALFFGFTIYGADVVRLTGPAAPTAPLATVNSVFPMVNNLFNRAIITVLANGPDSSMVKMEIIEDVKGAATRRVIMDNVLVPGFVIANEDYRFIAGGRTGGAAERAELDNFVYSVAAGPAPTLLLSNTATTLLGTIYDSPTNVVNASTVTATLNGAPLAVTATKAGSITTITHTAAPGAFFPAGTNTVVFSYTAGTVFTETRTFTVPPYYGFPPSMAVPLSQAGTPGFAVTVTQVAPKLETEVNLHNFLAFREGVMSGLKLGYDGIPYTPGGNTAGPGSVGIQPVINFEQDGASLGRIPNDVVFPGIPGNGTTPNTENFQTEALTWLAFPGPGLYSLGMTSDDGIRLSATHAPVGTLSIVSPAASARVFGFYPSVTGSPLGGIAGPNPVTPLVRKVVMAAPILADTPLTNAAEIAGNIALINRGGVPFAQKILAAQAAGAVAVVIVNESQPDNLAAGMGGDGTGITIPAGMISKGEGDILKALMAATPAGVTLSYGEDLSTTIAKDDRGRGWDSGGDVNATVAVPAAGLYPVRLFHFEGGGGANLEFYSIGPDGVKHLINDELDEASLKAYATITGGTGGGATISITRTGNSATITYTGTLKSSTDLTIWTAVTGATSPYTFTLPASGKLFFRAEE